MRSALLLTVLILSASPAMAEWIVGYEGDDTRGFGFISRIHRIPRTPGRELHVWTTASYLFYDVREAEGITQVTSPGLGVGVVYKWFMPRLELGVGPGYEVRWTRREFPTGLEEDETEVGPFVQADLGYDISSATRLSLQGSYSTANEWVFTRGHILGEIAPGLRAGPEASWQGNEDLRAISYGGVAEVPLQERTALQFHAGQSRVRYRGGNEETRPYFSVGIARSFR